MKLFVNITFILLLVATVMATDTIQHNQSIQTRQISDKNINVFKEHKEPKKYDKPDQAARWLADMRQTPKGYKNPSQYNMDIKRHIETAEKSLKASYAVPMRFDEIGPGVFGGRIRGFAIHPTKPGHLLAGGVSGGVWKSTNDGQSWVPKTDFLPNIAIGSMLVDPDNSERVYIGTGEGFFNFDAAQGAGIFVSEDFGETWQQLTDTNQPQFYYVNRMARIPGSDVLLAATNAGIMRSDDLGQSWQEASGHATTGRGFTDLKRDPSNKQHLLAYHFGNPNQVQATLTLTDPGSLAGDYQAVPANFGGSIPNAGISGEIVLANDGTSATQDACESIQNNISGKIALVQRGKCDFVVKVKNAQVAGAKAVIVYQNDSTLPIIMDGEDNSITISAVMIKQSLGNQIINTQSTVNGVIKPSEVTYLERFVMRSVDGGNSWQKLENNGLPIESVERMEIGFAQTGKVYVAVSTEVEELENGSFTKGTLGLWTASAGAQLQFNKTASQTNFIERQGWYDLAVAANPNDANHVLVGAIDLYASHDGGASIVKKSNWFVNPGQTARYMHADHHGYFFSPHNSNHIYFVNDGGVAKSVDGGNTFTNLNNGLNISQSYGIAVSPDGQYVNSGTQDNGAQLYFGDSQNWLEWQGGDGGYSAWDQQQGNFVYGSYINGQMYGSNDKGLTVESIKLPETEGARFIQPFVLDGNNGNRMLVGTNKVYYSNNIRQLSGASWQDVTGVISGASVSAVAFNPHKSSQAFAGMANVNNNHIVKIDGLGATNTVTKIAIDSQIVGTHTNIVTDIKVDEFDTSGNTLYVTLGGYYPGRLVKSSNGGQSWVDISLNLPNIPLYQVINDPLNADRLFVGSELGLWVGETNDGIHYDWQRYQYGPAFTRVVDLVWQGDHNLYIGTHGRGTYRAQRNPVSVTLLKYIASDASCDDDPYLDRGEKGQFMLMLENHSDQSLNQVTVAMADSGALTILDGSKQVNLAPFEKRQMPMAVTLSESATCGPVEVPVTVMTEFGQFTHYVQTQTAVNQSLTKGDFFAGAEGDDMMQEQLNLGTTNWIKDSSKAFNGNSSWFASSEDNYSDKTLTSPWLTLAGGGNELSFALSYDLEFGQNQHWDGALLEMQIQGEDQWLDIGLLSSIPYDGQLSNNNTAQGHFAWSGKQLEWREGSVDLASAYVGKTVRFRFRVLSDTNSFITGFWVDDIRLSNVYNQEKFSCDSCINSGNQRPTKGAWYDPKFDGHGFIIEYAGRDDLYYSMFYTYDDNGKPEWYLSYTFLENGVLNDGFEPETLQKPMYDYDINPEQGFPLIPDPSISDGRLRIDFNNQVARNHSACQDGIERDLDRVALAQWKINDEQQTWCIQPIVSDENKADPDFGNSWYAGEHDEGWGYSIIHAKNTLLTYLFYYDADGYSRWALADAAGLEAGKDYQTDFYQAEGYPRDGVKQPVQYNKIGTLRHNLNQTLQDLSTDGFTEFDVTYDGIEGGQWQRSNIPIRTIMQAH